MLYMLISLVLNIEGGLSEEVGLVGVVDRGLESAGVGAKWFF